MRWLEAAWQEVLDALYPPRCAACAITGSKGWCEQCLNDIEYVDQPVCIRCGSPVAVEKFCASCRAHPIVPEALRAVAHYRGAVRRAIHRCKYEHRPTGAPALAELLVHGWYTPLTAPLRAADAVIPVPIHPGRERERGFNQSALIASHFCRRIGMEYLKGALERTVYRQPQVGLDVAQRRQNVAGAFQVVNPSTVAGRSVLLIDDVWTTGSTLNEAALALLSAGASRVFAYTVAHESFD